jgi:hypothetical protein
VTARRAWRRSTRSAHRTGRGSSAQRVPFERRSAQPAPKP